MITLAPPGSALAGEQELVPVGGELAVRAVVIEDQFFASAAFATNEKKAFGMPPVMVPLCANEQLFAIGGPTFQAIASGMPGQASGCAAGCRHDIDLGRAIAIADEGDLLAIRGKLRLGILRRVGREQLRHPA